MAKKTKKKDVRPDNVKSIEIVKRTKGTLTEEQIDTAKQLIDLAEQDGYRITAISFF